MLFVLQVQYRPDVQQPDGRVPVVRRIHVELVQHLVKILSEVTQVFDGDRRILHERRGFFLALQVHDNVQTALPHFPGRLLFLRFDHVGHLVCSQVQQTELFELVQFLLEPSAIVPLVLHHQNPTGIVLDKIGVLAEYAVISRQVDQKIIHQFHGGGIRLDHVLHGVQRIPEVLELNDAKHRFLGNGGKVKLNGRHRAERSLRPHHQVCRIHDVPIHQPVERVPGDVPQNVGKPVFNFLPVPVRQVEQMANHLLLSTREPGRLLTEL